MQQPDWTERERMERIRESARYGVCIFLTLGITYAVYYYFFLGPVHGEEASIVRGLVDAFPILVMLAAFATWLWYLYASAHRQLSPQRLTVLGVASLAGFPLTLWAYQTYLQFQSGLSASDNLMISLYSLSTLVPVMVIGAAATVGFARWARGAGPAQKD